MGSEVDEASSQPRVEEQLQVESSGQGSRIEIGQAIQNLKHLKSYEIMTSAVLSFASNLRFMFYMILSILPLCASMIFYEIKLQKFIHTFPNFLDSFSPNAIVLVSYSRRNLHLRDEHDYLHELQSNFFSHLFQICLFYTLIYPLLELFSIVIATNFGAKVHSGETQENLKEVVYQNNNLKGTVITYLCVHLLSTLTLLGLFWVVVISYLLSARSLLDYDFISIELFLSLLVKGLLDMIFVALLYKYLGWSAFWNMSIVISVLEDETGIDSFGLTDYYGKHSKQTRFQLMPVFFAFGNLLRLPFLLSGSCTSSYVGVSVTAMAAGVFCLVNLVKWVAFALYFYDCKQGVMEKKG